MQHALPQSTRTFRQRRTQGQALTGHAAAGAPLQGQRVKALPRVLPK